MSFLRGVFVNTAKVDHLVIVISCSAATFILCLFTMNS